MIFNSIKWRLQLWYGLILVVVLAGFGFTAYQLEWGRQMRRIDEELQRRLGLISSTLHPPPRGPEPGRPLFDRPPPDRFPGDEPDRQNSKPPGEFHLPQRVANLFDQSDTNGCFYVIWSRDGVVIAQSANAVRASAFNALAPVIKVNTPVAGRAEMPGPPVPQTSNETRGVQIATPSGETILVGRRIGQELAELRLTAWKLAGFSGVILLFGLAGGSWLVGRALRPVEAISATAVKISAGDLSQRINVAEVESELGQLAAVLNSTFARLETAFAQQRQFTADAAHELRTPVSVMLTQAQTALNRERNAAEYRETVEVCQRAAQRMRRLIESLLELARLDAGQETLKWLRFDLSTVANDCVELVRSLAYERGVKILSEPVPLEIPGDSGKLAQVITNLLTNAVQYNRSGGEVHMKLTAQNGLAVLTVSDTGPGIAAGDLPHVFERFYRGDKSRTGSSGNAGLGLAISKAIVEAHGGTIEVSSSPDVGTTFTVRLPTA